MNQSEKITEQILLEVTEVSQKTWYPNGYGKGSERITIITLAYDGEYRKAEIKIAGNVPLGTRFELNIKQIDDVTPATIHRGALPIIEDKNLLAGGNEDVQ